MSAKPGADPIISDLSFLKEERAIININAWKRAELSEEVEVERLYFENKVGLIERTEASQIEVPWDILEARLKLAA